MVLTINISNREIGDVSTSISGSITKRSTNVPLSSSRVEFMINNNNTYTQIQTYTITGNPTTFNIPSFTHNPTNLIDTTTNPDTYPMSISYRVQTTDTYTASISSPSISSSYTINFYPYIYYGSFTNISDITTSGTTINSNGDNIDTAAIKTKLTKLLNNNVSNLTINTGTTNKIFVIALPSPKVLNSVIDTTDQNRNLTSFFSDYNRQITTINNSGISISYNIYIYTISVAYSSSRTFSITI
jgi:hypothetical protein